MWVAKPSFSFPIQLLLALGVVLAMGPAVAEESTGLDFARLAAVREVREVELSPDGRWVATAWNVPRRPGQDDDGRPRRCAPSPSPRSAASASPRRRYGA